MADRMRQIQRRLQAVEAALWRQARQARPRREEPPAMCRCRFGDCQTRVCGCRRHGLTCTVACVCRRRCTNRGEEVKVLLWSFLAGIAVGIGVPILLFYVYGVVTASLCRSGGCGGKTGILDDNVMPAPRGASDTVSMDAVSQRVANPSIGEASLASGSHLLREPDRESASTVALARSVGLPSNKLEVHADLISAQRSSTSSLSKKSVKASVADDGAASTRALARSMLNYKVNGRDSCSCVNSGEDCMSERVCLDEITASYTVDACNVEKASIGSGCSNYKRCKWVKNEKSSDVVSGDSIYVDIAPVLSEDKPKCSIKSCRRSNRGSSRRRRCLKIQMIYIYLFVFI